MAAKNRDRVQPKKIRLKTWNTKNFISSFKPEYAQIRFFWPALLKSQNYFSSSKLFCFEAGLSCLPQTASLFELQFLVQA